MITRDSLQFEYIFCLDFTNCGVIKYRDNVNKISAETITPRNEFKHGKARTIYFIDGVDKEFTDVDEMIDFYNEKFVYEGENPNTEVNFVKVYKNKKR